MQIGQAHDKLCQVLHALAALQGELQKLEEEQGTVDTETWEAGVLRLRKLKVRFFKIIHMSCFVYYVLSVYLWKVVAL